MSWGWNGYFVLNLYQGLNCIWMNPNYPSDAISAGIATAIRPTAAVAVSKDVLTVCF